MSEGFHIITPEKTPKKPDTNQLAMFDTTAQPRLDIAPPTMKPKPANTQVSLEDTSQYFYKPKFVSLSDYSSETELRKQFPALSDFNYRVGKEEFNDPKLSFFVIRCKKIDDIHKVG